MDINKFAQIIRNKNLEQILPMPVLKPEEKLANSFVGLNIYLAKTMYLVKLDDKKALIDAYCKTIEYFIDIANQQQWLYLLLLNDSQIASFKEKWQSKSFNNAYMIIQQQINKCYFNRQSSALVHAWHIFIKFGLVELKINDYEINDYFMQSNS